MEEDEVDDGDDDDGGQTPYFHGSGMMVQGSDSSEAHD